MKERPFTTRQHPELEKWVIIQRVGTDSYNVFLHVEGQNFRVNPVPAETLEDAQWLRDMLCNALGKIVADAKGEYYYDDK